MSKTKQAMKYYAGTGDAVVSKDIADALIDIANVLEEQGYILRVRGDEGTEEALVSGIPEDSDRIEVYPPWKGFVDWYNNYEMPTPGAFEMAWKVHPTWHDLTPDDRRYHAAGTLLVMGKDLKTPCDFLLCYTDKDQPNDDVQQVIRIADCNLIPVFDLGLGVDYTLNQLEEWLEKQ